MIERITAIDPDSKITPEDSDLEKKSKEIEQVTIKRERVREFIRNFGSHVPFGKYILRHNIVVWIIRISYFFLKVPKLLEVYLSGI